MVSFGCLSSGRKFIRKREMPAKELSLWLSHSTQRSTSYLSHPLAAKLAGLVGQVLLDHPRLGQPDIAIDQDRRLSHFVDIGAILRGTGLTGEEIHFHRFPVEAENWSARAAL